jgi:hypothetical protein
LTLTTSSVLAWSPMVARLPLIKTLPCSKKRSASRREHIPLSLMYLLSRASINSRSKSETYPTLRAIKNNHVLAA